MCTYYYLHYHHVAPCSKGVEYEVQYSFCANATTTFSSPAGVETRRTRQGGQQHHQQQKKPSHPPQKPSQSYTHAPDQYQHQYDYNNMNPCATGGCLLSQHCASGGCRLDELGGRWSCCRCGRGGNAFRWCVHRVRKVPDALCYHVVCRGCRAD